MATSATAILTSLRSELKKEYVELDGQDRPVKYYQAPAHINDGESCLITEVVYKDATSTLIIKSKEYIGTWSSAYEV